MEIIYKKTKALIPYENNPRINDDAVPKVAESIKQFGFRVPIIVDKDNVVVCGHTRLKAAQSLNMDNVPCIIADDLTDDQIKAFRLADNKVSEFAKWDFDALDIELGDIDMVMSDFGFAISEGFDIDDMFADSPSESSNIGEEEKEVIVCPHCGMKFEK